MLPLNLHAHMQHYLAWREVAHYDMGYEHMMTDKVAEVQRLSQAIGTPLDEQIAAEVVQEVSFCAPAILPPPRSPTPLSTLCDTRDRPCARTLGSIATVATILRVYLLRADWPTFSRSSRSRHPALRSTTSRRHGTGKWMQSGTPTPV